MNRTNSIEIIRIFAAIIIVTIHFNDFFGSNAGNFSDFLSIYVDLFFMLSGFFMMRHLDKRSNDQESVLGYSIHKINGFWAPLCIVNSVHLLLNCRMNNVSSVTGVLEKIWHFKWEFLLLQCAGFIQNPTFNQDYLIGSTWYLSALIIAITIAYPLAKHYRKIFTNVICTLSILIVYCGFSQAYGNMNIGNDFLFTVMDAVPRAFSGICCGALCYQATVYLEKRKYPVHMGWLLIDTACWIMLPLSVVIGVFCHDNSGLFMVIPFSVIIISCTMNCTPIAKALNRIPSAITGLLGKFSLYIYLTHWTCIFAVMRYCPQVNTATKILLTSALTLIYSLLLYILDCKKKNMKIVYVICLAVLLFTVVSPVFF